MRHAMVPAVYLILKNSDGKILGTLREHTGYMDGYWSLPAGHVEEKELPLKGAVRETKEEVGLDISPDNLKFVHLMIRPEENNNAGERVDIFFESSQWLGNAENVEPQKHEKVEWVALDSVPWMPYQKDALDYIGKGILYSEWKGNHE